LVLLAFVFDGTEALAATLTKTEDDPGKGQRSYLPGFRFAGGIRGSFLGRQPLAQMRRVPTIARFASLVPQLRRPRWQLLRSLRFDGTSAFDIKDRKPSEGASRQSEARYRAIFENAAVGIALVKPDGSWLQVNERLRQFLGYSADEFERLTFQDITYPEDLEVDLAQVRRVLDGEIDTYDMEKRYIRKDGSSVWAHLTVGCIRASNKTVELFVSVVEDIGARKQAELELQALSERDRIEAQARIAYHAHHDALTELPNRHTFELYLEAALKRARTLGEQLAVIYIGLDHFKQINDVFGTQVGDSVLCAVAQRLTDTVQNAFTARMGGDEFAVVCKAPQPMGAESLARSTFEGLGEKLDVAGHELQLEASMGVAIFPGDADSMADLIANADRAMEQAKAEGRHTIRFFDRRTDSELRKQRALHHDLRFAVERSELHLAYQPLVTTDRSVVGFEVLARWRHPVHGEVPPLKFIPLAEDGALISSIGRWILREACREGAAWTNPLAISINLSPTQFRQGSELVDQVRFTLEESGLAPNRLELEITERALEGNQAQTIALLRDLKSLGIRISVDDFGTGYSSLSRLKDFPLDKIKIDQSFVAEIDINPHSSSITQSIITLGHALGLVVLAEGVETEQQLAILTRESCDQLQGNLLGRPMPIRHYAGVVQRN
jgi:diguanylate cyclase (GGDEF)-like protein/PAS domain S-box-containing protein